MLVKPLQCITQSSIPNIANTHFRTQSKSVAQFKMETSTPHPAQKAEVPLAGCLAGKRISLKLLMSLECTNEDCILMQPDKEVRT